MGTLDKFINFMNMDGEEGMEDDYISEYDTDEDTAEPVTKSRRSVASDDYDDEKPVVRRSARNPVISNRGKVGNVKAMNNNDVFICKPVAFEDATKIADALLEERSVVLNLEGLDMELAIRIFDFVTGACYALKGRLESVSKFVYIITPESVPISGDTQLGGDAFGKSFKDR